MNRMIILLAAIVLWSAPVPDARAGDSLYNALEAYDAGRVKEAEGILERMTAAGDPEAMAMLAGFFETGQAGRTDLARSGALYHRAALAGMRHAQAKWADYLVAGRGGVASDIPQALCWFNKAANAGHNWAKERLAEEQANAPDVQAARNCR